MSTTAKGSKSKIVWKDESTLGTAASGNYYGLGIVNESLQEGMGEIVSDELQPDRTTPAVRGGNLANGGSITTDFALHKFGIWFRHLLAIGAVSPTDIKGSIAALAETTYSRGDYVKFGSPSKFYLCKIGGAVSAGEATAGLTHTSGSVKLASGATFEFLADNPGAVNEFVLTAGTDFPAAGLSIEKQIIGASAAMYVPFLGCRLNSLGLSIPQNGIVQANWGVLALLSRAGSNTSVAGTPVYTADKPVTGHESYININGNGALPVTTGELNIANNIDENVYVLLSRDRSELPEGRRDVNGSFTVLHKNQTVYDLFRNETEVPLVYDFSNNGRYMSITMPEVRLTGNGTPTISGAGIMQSSFNWRGFKEDGSYDIRIRLVTTETALR